MIDPPTPEYPAHETSSREALRDPENPDRLAPFPYPDYPDWPLTETEEENHARLYPRRRLVEARLDEDGIEGATATIQRFLAGALVSSDDLVAELQFWTFYVSRWYKDPEVCLSWVQEEVNDRTADERTPDENDVDEDD